MSGDRFDRCAEAKEIDCMLNSNTSTGINWASAWRDSSADQNVKLGLPRPSYSNFAFLGPTDFLETGHTRPVYPFRRSSFAGHWKLYGPKTFFIQDLSERCNQSTGSMKSQVKEEAKKFGKPISNRCGRQPYI